MVSARWKKWDISIVLSVLSELVVGCGRDFFCKAVRRFGQAFDMSNRHGAVFVFSFQQDLGIFV